MPKPTPLPEFHGVDRARFEAEIVGAGRPAVLRGLITDWPVVAAARQSDAALADWLSARATDQAGELWVGAPEIVGRFDFNATIDGYNHDRKLATIAQLLDLLLRQREDSEPYGLYAGALPLKRHIPDFLDANPMPLLDAGREMLVSLWLGNRTKTAAHWDLPQNLACVVAGRRRFTLFSTDQIANLYVGPLDFTLAGQPSSLVDVDDPDLTRFPKFAEALAAAETAELGPGDALYIPSLWWHAVRGLDPIGAMVNFWWRDGPGFTTTPMLALLHAVMAMQALPDRERDAWKTLFDHYAFAEDGDAVAHLPPAARGLLGAPDDAVTARTRARIARALSS
ncbi:cupin-like domain-containing protein [Sphingomonas koreensis]|nr:cupin-like domain-containing protein [Sphingomonas koreensis]